MSDPSNADVRKNGNGTGKKAKRGNGERAARAPKLDDATSKTVAAAIVAGRSENLTWKQLAAKLTADGVTDMRGPQLYSLAKRLELDVWGRASVESAPKPVKKANGTARRSAKTEQPVVPDVIAAEASKQAAAKKAAAKKGAAKTRAPQSQAAAKKAALAAARA